jgi:sugar fermentation stimulation protein A
LTYPKIVPGVFLERPNRFIAHVRTAGGVQVCHVKNTGRCRELLVPGAQVYLADCPSPSRKTRYDLVAVDKAGRLINMDSQAPNRVAAEYLPALLPGLSLLRPETRFGASRFDFYAEAGDERWFVEVKGVTLERDGEALFPDAPGTCGSWPPVWSRGTGPASFLLFKWTASGAFCPTKRRTRPLPRPCGKGPNGASG